MLAAFIAGRRKSFAEEFGFAVPQYEPFGTGQKALLLTW
jgi:hypothetical protein